MGFKCLGAFLSLLIVATAHPKPDSSDESLKAVATGVNKFGLNLLKVATQLEGSDKNILVSPLSASLATALLYQGSKGATKAEIQKGLNFPADDKQFEAGVSALIDNLNNVEDALLEVVNRVFVDKGIQSELKTSYTDALAKVHKSSLAAVDFAHQPDPSRIQINDWVSKKTHNRINNLLSPRHVDASTEAVLVNAFHFKAAWQKHFRPTLTRPASFHVSKDRQVDVAMMSKVDGMLYAKVPKLKSRVVSVPYEGGRFQMVLIVPDEIDGLSGVLDKLTSGAVSLDDVEFSHHIVSLSLPKFKIEDSHNLRDIYSALGISTMFGRADFSGIVDSSFSISAAMQKTFMEVNEEGTEAAGATAFLATRGMGPFPDEHFIVDRPTLILLSDVQTYDTALLAGVLQNPSSSQ